MEQPAVAVLGTASQQQLIMAQGAEASAAAFVARNADGNDSYPAAGEAVGHGAQEAAGSSVLPLAAADDSAAPTASDGTAEDDDEGDLIKGPWTPEVCPRQARLPLPPPASPTVPPSLAAFFVATSLAHLRVRLGCFPAVTPVPICSHAGGRGAASAREETRPPQLVPHGPRHPRPHRQELQAPLAQPAQP